VKLLETRLREQFVALFQRLDKGGKEGDEEELSITYVGQWTIDI
jgi:hypothetical protein